LDALIQSSVVYALHVNKLSSVSMCHQFFFFELTTVEASNSPSLVPVGRQTRDSPAGTVCSRISL